MKIIDEFKSFAIKGNVLDMAVGIIIGAAFGAIVNSLVNDVLMPPIGMLIGGIDFSDLSIKLSNPILNAKHVEILYGKFINTVINFLIVAFAIFTVVKAINKIKRNEAEKPSAPPMPSEEVLLLREIRDALKKK